MKIQVQNFQSLSNVEIEASGLTVVVGASNLGKSALVRAVEGALFNKPGEDFVREGKTRTNVTLTDLPTTKAPAILHWQKGHNLNEYEVNGVEYKKVGVSAPLAVAEAGYRDVWIGDKERSKGQWLRPQVQHQHDRLFLLSETGAFISDVMNTVSRLGALQIASGKCSLDLKRQKQMLGIRKTDLDAAAKKLKALAPIAALHERVQALGEKLKTIEAAQAVVIEARGLLQQRVLLVAVVRRELPAATAVPADLGATYGEARQAADARRKVVGAAGMALPAVTDVPVDFGATYTAARAAVAVWRALRPVRTLKLPETRHVDLDALAADEARMVSGRTQAALRAKLLPLSARTMPKPKKWVEALDKVEIWARKAADVAVLKANRERASADHFLCITGVRSTKQECEQTELTLANVMADLKVCPVCERPLGG